MSKSSNKTEKTFSTENPLECTDFLGYIKYAKVLQQRISSEGAALYLTDNYEHPDADQTEKNLLINQKRYEEYLSLEEILDKRIAKVKADYFAAKCP